MEMRWVPSTQEPHPVGNRWCSVIDHLAECEQPGPMYAWNLKQAQKGNKEAAYQVGLAYMQGWGVSNNPDRAEYWFRIGATTPYEKRWVGERFRDGQYVPADVRKVDYWFRAAGDHDSLLQLARIYRSATFTTPDPGKSASLCLELLKGGDGYVRLAEFELGNMVLDDQYASGDPKQDLLWAREVAQELIGQEEYKLAWANGLAMDLPGSPEVERAVVRSAAAFNVDLAQTRIADEFPDVSPAEREAWLQIAGRNRSAAAGKAKTAFETMPPAERAKEQAAVQELQQNYELAGAYYRDDDVLLNPDFSALERSALSSGDPEEQLRLAYHYEHDVGGTDGFSRAKALYKTVRDQRVGSVRLRIGNEYLSGVNGFPRNTFTAATWYGFAARGGSTIACKRLVDMKRPGC